MLETTSIISTEQYNKLPRIVYILRYPEKMKIDWGNTLNLYKAEKQFISFENRPNLTTQNVFTNLLFFLKIFIMHLLHSRHYTGPTKPNRAFVVMVTSYICAGQ